LIKSIEVVVVISELCFVDDLATIYMKINEKIHFLFSQFTKHEKQSVMLSKKADHQF